MRTGARRSEDEGSKEDHESRSEEDHDEAARRRVRGGGGSKWEQELQSFLCNSAEISCVINITIKKIVIILVTK